LISSLETPCLFSVFLAIKSLSLDLFLSPLSSTPPKKTTKMSDAVKNAEREEEHQTFESACESKFLSLLVPCPI
jgi:hypothetical protein